MQVGKDNTSSEHEQQRSVRLVLDLHHPSPHIVKVDQTVIYISTNSCYLLPLNAPSDQRPGPETLFELRILTAITFQPFCQIRTRKNKPVTQYNT